VLAVVHEPLVPLQVVALTVDPAEQLAAVHITLVPG
jgi:hypothetical protein